ncbi:hypothetical protein ACP70R_040241 [Stipagrostis hirtigluma subsp. patula]
MECFQRTTKKRHRSSTRVLRLGYSLWTKRGNKTWISHDVPKSMEISAKDLVSQLSPNGFLQPDTCDAIFRTFSHTDKVDSNQSSWRHFLESDFAVRVLAAENYLASNSIREQFVGNHINYDLSHCQMIFALAYIQNNWTAVAWDMKRRQITAFAPGYSLAGRKMHGPITSKQLMHCTTRYAPVSQSSSRDETSSGKTGQKFYFSVHP